MRKSLFSLAVAAIAVAFTCPSFATPMPVPCTGGVCVATISTSSGVNYTLTTSDNGTNFYNTFSTSSAGALDFANIYFDTNVGQPGDTGSNLGFELGPNGGRAFIPTNGGSTTYYSLDGTGVTFTDTVVNGTRTIALITPNSFFLTDPTGIPFAQTLSGGLVSIHYSQAFSYDMIGGSNNYALPNELGGAVVGAAPAPTPEPAGIQYMAIAGLSALSAAGRRIFKRSRA